MAKTMLAQHVNRVTPDLNNFCTAYDAFLWAVENGLMKDGSRPEELAKQFTLKFAPSTSTAAFDAIVDVLTRRG